MFLVAPTMAIDESVYARGFLLGPERNGEWRKSSATGMSFRFL